MKYFILLFLILSCTPPLPEEFDYSSACGGLYGDNCGDIEVLRAFIDANSLIERHYMDADGDDSLEYSEFGYQVWNNGRLVKLYLNYKQYIIMALDNPFIF